MILNDGTPNGSPVGGEDELKLSQVLAFQSEKGMHETDEENKELVLAELHQPSTVSFILWK